jgi:hypothetical protein
MQKVMSVDVDAGTGQMEAKLRYHGWVYDMQIGDDVGLPTVEREVRLHAWVIHFVVSDADFSVEPNCLPTRLKNDGMVDRRSEG